MLAVPLSIGIQPLACRVDVFGHLWLRKPVPGTAWVTLWYLCFVMLGTTRVVCFRVVFSFSFRTHSNSFKPGESTRTRRSLCCCNNVSKSVWLKKVESLHINIIMHKYAYPCHLEHNSVIICSILRRCWHWWASRINKIDRNFSSIKSLLVVCSTLSPFGTSWM